MKNHFRILLILAVLLMPMCIRAQQVVDSVTIEPVYPGGIDSMYADLDFGSIVYPEKARAYGREGYVAVSFVVKKNGSVGRAWVARDAVGYGVGRKIVKRVRHLKRFQPGTKNGEPARFRYTLPVRFALTN